MSADLDLERVEREIRRRDLFLQFMPRAGGGWSVRAWGPHPPMDPETGSSPDGEGATKLDAALDLLRRIDAHPPA